MSLIHCTCSCIYQNDGYCRLEKAAEITSGPNESGCLHFKAADKSSLGMNDEESKNSDF